MAEKKYDSKDIVVLEGLDAVRLRPGMYIGTTGSKGFHHLLWEIVDNAVDEVACGFGDTISITLNQDGSATVQDNGRGIPVSKHPTMKKSGVEVVYTVLHAGGKFSNENYKYSGGLHGVGASVTNALSRWCEVTVYREGKEFNIKFHSPQVGKKIKSGITESPLKEVGLTNLRGTRVTFLPDDRVFGDVKFSYDSIVKKARELAFLNKGVKIVVNDLISNQFENFCFGGGIADFVSYMVEGKTRLFKDIVYFEGENNDFKTECAFVYTDSYTENSFSYVNNIPTTEGGTHETGLRTAFTRVFNELARTNGLLKEKEENFLGEDFREGLTVILSIKMTNIQFEGQTKTKLGNPEARAKVENIAVEKLQQYFSAKENISVLTEIVNKAKGAAKVRIAAKKAKELTRAKNSADNFNLAGKLAASTSRDRSKSEIFIVEGESAGGSAKQGRDRSIQAILSLKGKPLNAEKKRMDQVLANEEIRTIISALGASIGEDFNLDNLKYNKVIILSDADQDGAHIRAILLTFFFRYMRQLISNGHVYIGMPPLYKVYKKDYIDYVYSDENLASAINKAGKGYLIQRYKGLGEMNAEQLWETTMDPEQRMLMQVTIEDAAMAEKMLTTWMGDDIDARKEYISKHANFDKDDNFMNKFKTN